MDWEEVKKLGLGLGVGVANPNPTPTPNPSPSPNPNPTQVKKFNDAPNKSLVGERVRVMGRGRGSLPSPSP